jgi:CspA family cold shock protein
MVDVAVETPETTIGKYTGQCKWFNDSLGYGFVTIQVGDDKGKDIFVHHSGIKPLNSHYKTLKKGEYINFNIVKGDNGDQAVDITGIAGGSLMCDVTPIVRSESSERTYSSPSRFPKGPRPPPPPPKQKVI